MCLSVCLSVALYIYLRIICPLPTYIHAPIVMCIYSIMVLLGHIAYIYIPYRGKLWRVETLADLANYHKVYSVKIPCLILNNIINFQIY